MEREAVKVTVGKDARDTLHKSIDDIAKILEHGAKISRMPDGSYLTSYDPFRVLRNLSGDAGSSSVTRGMLRDACLKAENIGPGSSHLLVKFAYTLLGSLIKREDNPEIIKAQVTESIKETISRLPSIAEHANFNVLKKTVHSFTDDGELTELILEAASLAGSECKIFIEPSPALESTVERINGFTFKLAPSNLFYKSGKWAHDKVKVFILDGIIESMSEVDTLFRKCHEQNQPLAIFARGFSPEVMSTMRVNWIRGTLKVIPIEVQFDLESVNVLNDLAIAAGGDVVSSLKGELISTVDLEDLPVVQRVVCKGSSVSIMNPTSTERIMQHATILKQKRDSEQFTNVKQILDKRIKSLSSSSVVIRVASNTAGEMTQRLQKLDLGLRAINAALAYGNINSTSFKRRLDDLDDSVAATIKSLDEFELPMTSVAAMVKFGGSLAMSLFSVGAVLELDLLELEGSR